MQRQEVRDFAGWRAAARPLLARAVRPEEIVWSAWRAPSLRDVATDHAGAASIVGLAGRAPAIPRRLMQLLEDLACYRDPNRWELMYRLTWRVLNQNRNLLDNDADPDVQVARTWEKSIHRDVHKLHAFVRFHETDSGDGNKHYIAWFKPAHEILRTTESFFEKHNPNMRWMIATPDGAAHW